MSHIITRRSIRNYRDHVRSDITEVCWRAGPIDRTVFANLPNLETLVCTGNKLTSIDLRDLCPKLLTLNCSANRIHSGAQIRVSPSLTTLLVTCSSLHTIGGIHAHETGLTHTLDTEPGLLYPNLRVLDCSSTNLTTLEGIEACPLLETLDCSSNRLVSLEHMVACPNLVSLTCMSNQLTSLDMLTNCRGLEVLDCSNNRLTTLEGIQLCINLRVLDCSNNKLTTLDALQACILLEKLDCHSNLITILGVITELAHLRVIDRWDNPLEVQRAEVMNRLDRLGLQLLRSRNIYNDGQSVHDPHIQQSVQKSLANLQADPVCVLDLRAIEESGIDKQAYNLLQRYCKDPSPHSDFGLSYAELLTYVWARIDRSEHRTEMIRVLGEQVIDGIGMCFTGIFNRLISVLSGFYPDITIEIAGAAQINAIIAVTRRQVEPYTTAKHIAIVKTRLEELSLDSEQIQPWLDAIQEAE